MKGTPETYGEVTLRRVGFREYVEHLNRMGTPNVMDEVPDVARVEGNRKARRAAGAKARRGVVPKPSDPMDPPPPWLADGETWLRQHANMCRHPSRYMA